MVWLSNEQVSAIAANLGHDDLSVQQTPAGRWFFTCSCGARSTNRRTSGDAAGAAAHHMQVIVRAALRSGAPLSRLSGGKGAAAPAADHHAA